MTTTTLNLYRSVRVEEFPSGTIIEDQPAPAVLYPDFEPRLLPSGKMRPADVVLSEDKQLVRSGGGTSLFDRAGVFKARGWLPFEIPAGTVVPEPLVVRHTGYNSAFRANHYQIEVSHGLMRVDAFKGALDNLARNAVVRAIELATGQQKGANGG